MTSQCHAQDRATTTLHEETHAPAVYSPGTQDNGYGYAAATALSSSRAVLNADSYALYANGKSRSPFRYSTRGSRGMTIKDVSADDDCSYLLWLLEGSLQNMDREASTGLSSVNHLTNVQENLMKY